jgi:phosphatidate phosphatase PAH1
VGAKIGFEILHIPKSAQSEEPVYQKLCEAFTNEDGIASAELKGFFEGAHLIRCTYIAIPAVKAVSRVFVIKPETPVLVCDIDHTIADISTLGFLTSKPEDIPVVPGSVEALKKLSEKFLIVYLTARDDSFLAATMQWLGLKGFPQGPVFFSDLSKTAFLGSAEKFKKTRLAAWRKAGINLQAGVGDRPEDARAYLSNNIRAFILSGKPEKLPVRADAVTSWAEISDALLK